MTGPIYVSIYRIADSQLFRQLDRFTQYLVIHIFMDYSTGACGTFLSCKLKAEFTMEFAADLIGIFIDNNRVFAAHFCDDPLQGMSVLPERLMHVH